MNRNGWEKALDEMKEDIISVEGRANHVSKELPVLSQRLESLKIDILEYKLEKERRHLAGVRGFTAFKKDKRKLYISLGAAAVGVIFGGAYNKDSISAFNAGISLFNSSLQGFGNSRWAVSLDGEMIVTQEDQITPGRDWVTLESFNHAMEKLKQKALDGKQLGDIEAVLPALKQEHTTLKYLVKSSNGRIYYLQQMPGQVYPALAPQVIVNEKPDLSNITDSCKPD